LVPVGEAVLRGLSRSEGVHQLVHEALAAPVASLGSRADRLGSWATRLVGRARERAEVSTLLEQSRLVTIAGAGGAGKTRLAHAVTGDLTGRFTDVVWVELAQVTVEGDVATAVARASGAVEVPGVELVEVLIGFLGASDVLIVLDNCEHVLGPCATLVEQLLRATPRVRVLTTSREPLGVSGEVTWRIPSLEVPAETLTDPAAVGRCDAPALFVDRAQAALPNFVLDDATVCDVAAICRRLDGLPLAIELAAARLRSMTLRAVTDGLDDRFRLLTGGSRTALPRQQTLSASVDWSYTLCEQAEQQLLRRLAIFVTPFSVEAAEAISAEGGADRLAVFDLLSYLVDKSLVQPAGDRYRLLETIRQFALERAGEHGELAQLRGAHLRWFTNRSARWRLDRDILTETTMREIGLESPDLLGALEWSLQAESGPAVGLLWPLGRHWLAQSSFAEVSRMAGLVLERFEIGSAGWFTALAPMAEALTMAEDPNWMGEARALLATGFAAPVDTETRASLDWLTMGAPGVFTEPHGLSRLESFVEVGRREGNRAIECGAAATLAFAHGAAGAVHEADRWCEWLDRRLPQDAWVRASLAAARGYVALFRCEFDAAWRAVSDRVHRRPAHLGSAAVAGLIGVYTGDQGFLTFGLDAFEATRAWGAYRSWSVVFRVVEAIGEGRLADARTILEPAAGPAFLPNQSPLNERLRTLWGSNIQRGV
jgi:predicted ATPase